MDKRFFLIPAFLAQMLLGASCSAALSTHDVPAVKGFELSKYLGVWHEIARYDHVFERGMTSVRAEYSLRGDGLVRVVNSGLKHGRFKSIEGVARLKGAPDIGELEVSFFRPFYGDYRIILLEEDCSSAIVTGSTRNYLWILARTETIPASRLEKYMLFLRENGFDAEKLIILQEREEVR